MERKKTVLAARNHPRRQGAIRKDPTMKETSKTILITGASSGFGRDMAETLAADAHKVYGEVRDLAGRNSATAVALRGKGVEVVELDVTSDAEVEDGIKSLLARSGGKLDVVINNAGIFSTGVSESFTTGQLRDLFEVKRHRRPAPNARYTANATRPTRWSYRQHWLDSRSGDFSIPRSLRSV